jgi:dGTPase
VRIFEVLEDLNLTWEVGDGIRAHSWKIEPPPATPEAMCVRFADRIAYLTHDALDAMRAGVLARDELPDGVLARLGEPGRAWIGEMIEAVADHSLTVGQVAMDGTTLAVMHELREFMFGRVYQAPSQRGQQVHAIELLRGLMDHHLAHADDIPASYRQHSASLVIQAADYVAGMTDRFALATYGRVFGAEAAAASGLPGS